MYLGNTLAYYGDYKIASTAGSYAGACLAYYQCCWLIHWCMVDELPVPLAHALVYGWCTTRCAGYYAGV